MVVYERFDWKESQDLSGWGNVLGLDCDVDFTTLYLYALIKAYWMLQLKFVLYSVWKICLDKKIMKIVSYNIAWFQVYIFFANYKDFRNC